MRLGILDDVPTRRPNVHIYVYSGRILPTELSFSEPTGRKKGTQEQLQIPSSPFPYSDVPIDRVVPE